MEKLNRVFTSGTRLFHYSCWHQLMLVFTAWTCLGSYIVFIIIVGYLSLKCESHNSLFDYISQGYETLCSLPELLTSPAVLVNPDFCFEMVARKLTYLNEDIKDLCQKKLGKLSKKGKTSCEYVWNDMLTKYCDCYYS